MLLRKINIVFLVLFAGVFSVCAQKRKVQTNPYIDNRIMHLGFFVGMHIQDMVLINSGYIGESGEAWFVEIPSYSPGFNVGLLSDLYLHQFFSLRFSPSLAFGEKGMKFCEQTSKEIYSTTVRSNYLTIPLDVRFNSSRINNYRPYILTGAYGAFDLGRKKGQAVRLNGTDFGITVGMGCDFYYPYFKFCPELRFSFGLVNLIQKKRTDLNDKQLIKYSDALESGKSRMISLVFNFE